jgi:hypothetical protein
VKILISFVSKFLPTPSDFVRFKSGLMFCLKRLQINAGKPCVELRAEAESLVTRSEKADNSKMTSEIYDIQRRKIKRKNALILPC